VGTEIVTSRDAPALSMVYKLVEIENEGRVEYTTKFSEEKSYSPGRKQVFRFSDRSRFHHDLIARADERYPDGAPLLEPVMKHGRRIVLGAALEAIRARARESIQALPDEYQALENAALYPVQKSDAIELLLQRTRARYFTET
jgi:nicotinate phosphoribosyltransferase